MMKKISSSLIPGISWLTASTILLTLPGSAFPKENWLSDVQADKWIHLGMFSLLVWLWCWGIKKYRTASINLFAIIAIVGTIYGVMMELVQHYFIPNRSFDYGDIIADAGGSLLGFIYSWKRYIKK